VAAGISMTWIRSSRIWCSSRWLVEEAHPASQQHRHQGDHHSIALPILSVTKVNTCGATTLSGDGGT
jgi:hypothetical protein